MPTDPLSEIVNGGSNDALLEHYSLKNGVDPDLARRLMSQESRGRVSAVSPKGAQGLMQLMPGTAKQLGITDPFDVHQNLDAGTKYLRQQLDEFGDPHLALAAYNAGPGAVKKFGNKIPPYRETQNYVKKIGAGYQGNGYAEDPLTSITKAAPITPSDDPTPEQIKTAEADVESKRAAAANIATQIDAVKGQDPLTAVTKPEVDPLTEITSGQLATPPSPQDLGTGRGAGMARASQAPPASLRGTKTRPMVRKPFGDVQGGVDAGTGLTVQPTAARSIMTRPPAISPGAITPMTNSFVSSVIAQKDQADTASKGLSSIAAMGGVPTSLLPKDAEDWINSAVAQGGSGLLNTAAGLVRHGIPALEVAKMFGAPDVLMKPVADKLQAASSELGRASQAIDRNADRGVISQTAKDVVGGGIATTPAMVLMSMGIPAPVAFGMQSSAEAQGRDADLADTIKETTKGAAIGALFELPLPSRIAMAGQLGQRLAKAGIVGAGTKAADLASGANPNDNTSAIVNALFAASGAPKAEAPQVAPPEASIAPVIADARAERVRAATEGAQPTNIAPAPEGTAAAVKLGGARGRLSTLSSPENPIVPNVAQAEPLRIDRSEATTTLNRWQHRDFGAVTESANQAGVGKGRVRVLAEDGSEHVIQRPNMRGEGNQIAVPIREKPLSAQEVDAQGQADRAAPFRVIDRRGQNESTDIRNSAEQTKTAEPQPETKVEGVKEPSTTSARKSQMSADRAALDLPELPPAERKGWQTSLDNAKEKGLDKRADLIAAEVLKKPRALDDEETAGLVLRGQELKNEHARVMKEIGVASDPEQIAAKIAERDAIESALDTVTAATKKSGSEKGRSFAAQKLTINQDFDLASMVQRAKAAKGRELTPEERTKHEGMAKQIEDLNSQLADAHEKIKAKSIQGQIDKVVRQRKRSETKEVLDDEFAALRAQFAKAKLETRSGVQGAGLAGLDPEGKLTPLIAKMARNRVKSGINTAEGLVDEIYSAVKEHIEGITKRDVRDAISGYGMEPRGDRRSQEATQLADIRSQLKKLSAQEDIATGKRLSPRDKTRQTQLLKQETELTRRLEQKDFSPRVKPEPIVYNRETLALTKKVEQIKRDYENELYKANRGTRGRIYDEVSKFGNLPKTLKSMADISAVFRQGGFYALSHPVEGLIKPSRDMFKSFSEMGYRNVENAIKSHPKFDLAKRSGIEFTGVDKNDPNLSHKEEGYLGTDALGTISKGRLNPLRLVKGTADFSERTFVSFLDSQRIHVFDQMTKGLESQGITYRQNPEAYKAAAKLVNIGTGRGDLGVRGNQAAPLLNLGMFSPRLVASRVQLLNNMFNPVKIASMPRGTRAMMIKDNVKFLAATAAVMGLAKAAGGTVNTDPDDGDFLKIRFGSTTYDTLTGIQQPLRAIINMGRAVKADVTKDDLYPGKTKSEIASRFARSKLAPLAGAGIDYLTGTDFNGRQFSATREARDLLTPLPASDFVDAMKKEGLVKGFVKALPTVTGIGVQTYDTSPEKATTQAEKLARKIVASSMGDKARTDEEIDKSKQVSDLRARSRQGQNISAEVKTLGLTDRQKKAVEDAKGLTRLQEDVKRLSIEDAIRVYRAATPSERQQIKDLLADKAEKVDEMDQDRQAKVKEQMAAIGMKPGGVRPRKPQEPNTIAPRRVQQHYGF